MFVDTTNVIRNDHNKTKNQYISFNNAGLGEMAVLGKFRVMFTFFKTRGPDYCHYQLKIHSNTSLQLATIHM